MPGSPVGAATVAMRLSFKFVDFSFYVLLVCAVVFCLSKTIPEFDLWGHLKFGSDFLQDGKILQVDPYSYLTSGTRWLDHEWLAEIIFGSAYNAGGVLGLSLVRLATIALLFTLLVWRLQRSNVPPLLTGFIVILATILCTPGISPARPQMFTYLCFAIEMLILESAEYEGRTVLLFLLPFIFAFWANTHGGFLAGLATLFIWTGVRVVWPLLIERKQWDKTNFVWMGIAALSVAATLITPYGSDLLVFLLKTGTIPRPEIPEWQPLVVTSLQGALYLLMFPVVFLGLLANWRNRPAASFTLLACMLLPFMAMRHLALATIAIIVLLSKTIGGAINANEPVRKQFVLSKGGTADRVMSILCVLSALGMLVFAIPRASVMTVGEKMPIKAVRILRGSNVKANMACFFDWGEYCIWHLYPNIKVSVDGRRETAYNDLVYAENVQFTYGVGDWDKLIKDANAPTDLVLASKDTAVYALMSLTPGWKQAYSDKNGAVFAREGSEMLSKIERATKQIDALQLDTNFP